MKTEHKDELDKAMSNLTMAAGKVINEMIKTVEYIKSLKVAPINTGYLPDQSVDVNTLRRRNPELKVGDVVKHKMSNRTGIVTDLLKAHVCVETDREPREFWCFENVERVGQVIPEAPEEVKPTFSIGDVVRHKKSNRAGVVTKLMSSYVDVKTDAPNGEFWRYENVELVRKAGEFKVGDIVRHKEGALGTVFSVSPNRVSVTMITGMRAAWFLENIKLAVDVDVVKAAGVSGEAAAQRLNEILKAGSEGVKAAFKNFKVTSVIGNVTNQQLFDTLNRIKPKKYRMLTAKEAEKNRLKYIEGQEFWELNQHTAERVFNSNYTLGRCYTFSPPNGGKTMYLVKEDITNEPLPTTPKPEPAGYLKETLEPELSKEARKLKKLMSLLKHEELKMVFSTEQLQNAYEIADNIKHILQS